MVNLKTYSLRNKALLKIYKETTSELSGATNSKTTLKQFHQQLVTYLPLNFCSPLLLEDYRRDALRNELIITSLIEQFQTSILIENVLLINFISH